MATCFAILLQLTGLRAARQLLTRESGLVVRVARVIVHVIFSTGVILLAHSLIGDNRGADVHG